MNMKKIINILILLGAAAFIFGMIQRGIYIFSPIALTPIAPWTYLKIANTCLLLSLALSARELIAGK